VTLASILAHLSGFLSYLFPFILILGFLILIHEAGHFAVAKLLGIRVEVFSLGFGPRLLSWRRNHTEYRGSALPLGGYVKMLGENPDEELPAGPEAFLNRSKWQRFAVLVMGATLNIVLAVVIMSGIFMHGVSVQKFREDPPVVGAVEKDSPAEKGGLRPLDRIVKVGDQDTPTWNDLLIAVALNPGRRLPFRIVRDGATMTLDVTVGLTKREEMGRVGVAPYITWLVGSVEPSGPAEKAGLRSGDRIVTVAGLDVGLHAEEVGRAIAESPGAPIPVVVERFLKKLERSIVLGPAPGEEAQADAGFTMVPESVVKKYGPIQAAIESLRHNAGQSDLLLVTLRKLVTRQLSLKTLSGPIEIFKLSGEAWKGGAIVYLSLMAAVILQLGIMNLLPIPVLDGGHIFILAVEGLMRRDLSMVVKERVMQVGFVLLLLLMGTVLYQDVYKNLPQ